MAIAASYFLSNKQVTTTAVAYTLPTTYNRDLVITAGTAAIYVSMGAATSAVTTSSFLIPAGQSLVLMGAVPTITGTTTASQVFACIAVSGGTSSVSLGYASVVSVV